MVFDKRRGIEEKYNIDKSIASIRDWQMNMTENMK